MQDSAIPLLILTGLIALGIYYLAKKTPDRSPASKPLTKTCPHCKESDLQPDAKVCKHCHRKLKNESGCITFIAVACVILGFFWWPAFIFALLLFIWAAIESK